MAGTVFRAFVGAAFIAPETIEAAIRAAGYSPEKVE